MLTGKQKQYLKGTAVDFSAVVQIGKEGITDNVGSKTPFGRIGM